MSQAAAQTPLLAPLEDGLARALQRAPLLLALGMPEQRLGAQVARAAFVRNACVDVLPMAPSTLHTLGPNLLRQVGLCLILDPLGEAPWAQDLIAYVQGQRCPALYVGPPQSESASRATWQVNLAPSPTGLVAQAQRFVQAGAMALLLSARAQRLRESAFGPKPPSATGHEQALTDALTAPLAAPFIVHEASQHIRHAHQVLCYGEGTMDAAAQYGAHILNQVAGKIACVADTAECLFHTPPKHRQTLVVVLHAWTASLQAVVHSAVQAGVPVVGLGREPFCAQAKAAGLCAYITLPQAQEEVVALWAGHALRALALAAAHA